MADRGALLRAIVAALAAALGGCVHGPELTPLGLPHLEPAPARVVVSEFYFQAQVPADPNAFEARPSVGVDDISLPAASYLASLGLRSEAGRHTAPESLAPGELLLRGYLVSAGRRPAVAVGLVSGLTLAVVGGILPYPIPLPVRCRFNYAIHALTSDGKELFARRGTLDITYRHHFLWSAASQDCAGTLVLTEVQMHLFEELARALSP